VVPHTDREDDDSLRFTDRVPIVESRRVDGREHAGRSTENNNVHAISPDPVWLSVSTDTAAFYWRLIATRSNSSGPIR
jgi:hypothetical protein